MLKPKECEYCGNCDEGDGINHECSCGDELTEKQCKEFSGLCYQCMWLLDK